MGNGPLSGSGSGSSSIVCSIIIASPVFKLTSSPLSLNTLVPCLRFLVPSERTNENDEVSLVEVVTVGEGRGYLYQ